MKDLIIALSKANFSLQRGNGEKFVMVGKSSEINELGISVLNNAFQIEPEFSGYLVYLPVCGDKSKEKWCLNSKQEVVNFLNEQYC